MRVEIKGWSLFGVMRDVIKLGVTTIFYKQVVRWSAHKLPNFRFPLCVIITGLVEKKMNFHWSVGT